MLVVFGQQADNHITRAVAALEWAEGDDFIIVDRYNPPRLTIFPEEVHEVRSRASVVWWRVKPPLTASAFVPEGVHEQYFFQSEWGLVDQFLIGQCCEAAQINRLDASNSSNNKILQLNRASHLGWSIPKTVVTTDADEVIRMFSAGNVVFKQLSGTPPGVKGPLLTTEIPVSELPAYASEIARCPGIFQEVIEKVAEWRINVFGDLSFGVEITQEGAEGVGVDWRRAHARAGVFEAIPVPPDVHSFCLHYLASFGMKHGVFDFALDRSGTVYFLECNPFGQYTFIEDLVGQPLSEAMASLIAGLRRTAAAMS